ncbi:hypothetical protein [Streptomyces sp. NBC_00286]|uniref:hypothetical protein n=1 Tax=Streptomyces sp. NBC_00286 TaxID=2975701 RepID=UPI002E2B048C|nr:hypothetical protein [Streptomyces sp. NBC_00286]
MGRGLLSLVLAAATSAALLVAPAAAAPPTATAPVSGASGAAAPPPPGDVYRPVRGPSAPAEYRYMQKTVPGESIPRHAHELAAAQARELPTVGGRWKGVGPTNIGGCGSSPSRST